jgi:cytoskeletal protein RodZ
MTMNPPRRPSRRGGGQRSAGAPSRDGRSAVGEQLRDAREIKGIDIFRAERDTKIRSKYLTALEQGDYADLPGDTYARGFLRNYASYLGLDADEIEEQWRSQAGAPEPGRSAIVGPQPMTIRRGIVFQRSHAVIAVVLVIILIVASYFGLQLTRYLAYPTLAIESHQSTPVVVAIGSTSYVLKGTATSGTTVLISWNGQDPKLVVTDDSGHWTYQAALQAGSNQFDITAKNLDTGHPSPTIRVIVLVPVPTATPTLPELAFSTPTDGATISTANVTVTGISTEVTTATLTPTYLGPPLAPGVTMPPPTPSAPPAVGSPNASVSPSQSPSPSPSPSPIANWSPGTSPVPTPSPTLPPQPLSVATAGDGTFTFTIPLGAGLWRLTLVGTSPRGISTAPVSRTINIPFKGLTVLIEIKGGPAGISVYHDNVTDTPGYVQVAGWKMTVVAKRYVCIKATKPTFVYITVNGTSYGPVSSLGGQRAYIDLNGARNSTSCP